MITISLCMIVKNEESVIGRCLDSIADAVDEIIIVDTGSVDRTKEIAAAYTKKIYDFKWIDDFSAARNFGYEKAGMDYQMWLDADDVITVQEKEKLLALKAELPADIDMVTMQYHVHFDEFGHPSMSSMRERLTRTQNQYRWIEPVHECIPLQGKLYHADIAIEHRKESSEKASWRNIHIYEAMEKGGHSFSPRQLYYFARECKDHQLYEKAINYYEAFLNTGQGWVEDNIGACRGLAECYRYMGNEEKDLQTLLRSFAFDSPRAEVVCSIAYYYKDKLDYRIAADWFHLALGLNKPESFCFTSPDYYDYIPHIELSVCLFHLGNLAQAIYHNEQAAVYKPESKAVAFNKEFYNRC